MATTSGSCHTGLATTPASISPAIAKAASYRSLPRPPTTCDSGASNSRMPTSGASSRHSASSADSRVRPTPPARAMRRVPRCPTATARVLVWACSRVSSTRRASSRNTCPAGVRRTPRCVRSSSATPRSASSWRIVRDRGDCSTCSRRAARPKCNSSATAMKQRRWRKFMYFPPESGVLPLAAGNRMSASRWRCRSQRLPVAAIRPSVAGEAASVQARPGYSIGVAISHKTTDNQ